MTIKAASVRILNRLLRPFGAEIVRHRATHPHIRPYVNAKQIQAGAKRASIDVFRYVEQISPNGGVPREVIDRLEASGVLRDASTILEIGTGAGRFAHEVLERAHPTRYESYEPDEGWSDWLRQSLGILSQPSDGYSLSSTTSASVDLVMAHGVFLYLPFLTALRYFAEIGRVTHGGSYVAFDIYSSDCFDEHSLATWLESDQTWPVILPKDFVVELFSARGFVLVEEFFSRLPLRTHYLVFRRSS
jgi:hypothetical protein